jgi:hypothetical protein
MNLSTYTFTAFETWALSQSIPWLELHTIVAPTKVDLSERWHLLSLDLTSGSEKAVATCLIRMGALAYLEVGEKENVVTKA